MAPSLFVRPAPRARVRPWSTGPTDRDSDRSRRLLPKAPTARRAPESAAGPEPLARRPPSRFLLSCQRARRRSSAPPAGARQRTPWPAWKRGWKRKSAARR